MKAFNKIRKSSGKFNFLRFDRKVMVFLFFLAVSSLIWFMGALGREYTAQLRYPVRYSNFPGNLVLINELPSTLDLTVNAHGYTLLRHYIGRRMLPIVLDLNSYPMSRLPETDTRNFYMLSSFSSGRIATQLGSDISVIDIKPDTLFFRFTEMTTRMLPVRPSLDLQFDKQFMMKGEVSVFPDSVFVSGPGAIIDTMEFIPTHTFRKTGINKPLQETVRLAAFSMLNYSEERVSLTVPVEQFTEATIRIPLEKVNIPDTLTMKTFPSEITVSYLVALSDYDRVSAQQFRAVADFRKIAEGNSRLDIELVNQPGYVKLVRFTPRNVDYIIER